MALSRASKPAANAAQEVPASEVHATAPASVAEATKPGPVFEAEGDETPVNEAAKVATTTALASVGSRAVATTGGSRFKAVLGELENVIPPDQAEALKRIKSSAGVIRDTDGHNYGDSIEVTLVSFHSQWVASPGSDDEDAKADVRYSYDGATISSDGSSLQDYVEMLKTTSGYEKAGIKQYGILVGILNSSAKGGGMEGDLVQISLSPQSKGSFDNYRIQSGVKLIQGRIPADADLTTVKIVAESKQSKGRDYTLLKVVSLVG